MRSSDELGFKRLWKSILARAFSDGDWNRRFPWNGEKAADEETPDNERASEYAHAALELAALLAIEDVDTVRRLMVWHLNLAGHARHSSVVSETERLIDERWEQMAQREE